MPKPGASEGIKTPFLMTDVPGSSTMFLRGTPGGETPADRSPQRAAGIEYTRCWPYGSFIPPCGATDRPAASAIWHIRIAADIPPHHLISG